MQEREDEPLVPCILASLRDTPRASHEHGARTAAASLLAHSKLQVQLPRYSRPDACDTGFFARLFPPAAAAAASACEEPVGARAGVVVAAGVGAARLAGKLPASLSTSTKWLR